MGLWEGHGNEEWPDIEEQPGSEYQPMCLRVGAKHYHFHMVPR